MTITYIPDLDFGERVDQTVGSILEGDTTLDREAADQRATEALLAGGIWPASWADLMPDGEKATLIDKIVAERGQR